MNHVGAGTQSLDELAESALQGRKKRAFGGLRWIGFGLRLRQNTARQAAVLRFNLRESREYTVDAHLARIAAIDAREQRLGQIVDRFLAVVVQQKIFDRAIGPRIARLAEKLQAHADLGAPTQEVGFHHGHDLGGDHHHQALGQPDQLALLENVGDARMVVRSDDLIGEPQFADQIHGPWFGAEKSVGTFFEHTALDDRGSDHAANARLSLHDGGPDAGLRQVVGSGKTGDSAADDQRFMSHTTS